MKEHTYLVNFYWTSRKRSNTFIVSTSSVFLSVTYAQLLLLLLIADDDETAAAADMMMINMCNDGDNIVCSCIPSSVPDKQTRESAVLWLFPPLRECTFIIKITYHCIPRCKRTFREKRYKNIQTLDSAKLCGKQLVAMIGEMHKIFSYRSWDYMKKMAYYFF